MRSKRISVKLTRYIKQYMKRNVRVSSKFGTLLLISVAEKNGGSFAISCDENEFVAVVMI